MVRPGRGSEGGRGLGLYESLQAGYALQQEVTVFLKGQILQDPLSHRAS